jgi:hypothetical protein
MDHEDQSHRQDEPKNDQVARDLDKEREKFEQMIERESKASREYTRGKLLSA